MATELQDTYVAAPAPAPAVPTFKDTAAQIVGTDAQSIARGVMEMAPKPPSADEYRVAQQRAADARNDMMRRQTSFDEAIAPQIEEYRVAAQRYADTAQQNVPKPAPVQPAPSRGLQPFLTAREDESVITTLQKFMQGMTLFATMAGGGRNGARASLSALTGAMEGWREGSRYNADTAFQNWRNETEAMFRKFDDEMQSYRALMSAERVPLDQKMRGLELSAMQHKNAMLAEEFRVTEADKAIGALEKRQQAYQNLQKWYAGIVAAKETADQKHQEALDKVQAQIDKTNLLMDAKANQLKLDRAIFEWKQAQVQAKPEKPQGYKVGTSEQKPLRDYETNDDILKELDRLAGEVDLRKVVGGVRPWLNDLKLKWGSTPGPMPEGQSVGTPTVKGAMTDKEQRFLALLAMYADNQVRSRSGAAAAVKEMDRMMTFLPNETVGPQAVRTRLTMSRDLNARAWGREQKRLQNLGYNMGTYQGPVQAPTAKPGDQGPVWTLRGPDGLERPWRPDPGETEKDIPAGYTRVR